MVVHPWTAAMKAQGTAMEIAVPEAAERAIRARFLDVCSIAAGVTGRTVHLRGVECRDP